MTRDEIFEKVKGVLVDALGVDDDEVAGHCGARRGRWSSAATLNGVLQARPELTRP